ncbi:MAG: MoaD/ThiS family protein [Bacteroidales bacterium]
MRVMVLFFGVLTGVTGTGTRFYENVKDLENLRLRIIDDYPGIENYNFRISVNNELFSGDNISLNDGDEVAFIPPFAGG